MDNLKFEAYRADFVKLMAMKSTAEIRAMRNSLNTINRMTEDQRCIMIADLSALEKQLLDCDLEKLEGYKKRTHSTFEEFNRIMTGFYKKGGL